MGVRVILTKFRSIFLLIIVILSLSLLLFDLISGEGGDLRKSTSFNYILNSTLYPHKLLRLKTLPKHPKLQLIELTNGSTKENRDQAVVIIHGNYKQGNMSLNLFLEINKQSKQKKGIRYFSIECNPHKQKFKDNVYNVERYLAGMHELLDHLTYMEGVRRISFVVCELAADVFLEYLSRVSLEFYPYIDKVILINARYKRFSPQHTTYDSHYTKILIRFNETERNTLINQLRIISIQTDRMHREWPNSHDKLILLSGISPSMFLHIHGRFIWSVYMFLDIESAFHFSPFLNILASFIHLDQRVRMGMKQIDYFFRYKQNPILEPVSMYKHEFALDCVDVHGSNFVDSRYYLKKGCWIFKFLSNHNSGLIFESRPEVELFTQRYLQIPPFLSDNIKTIYFINNLSSFNGLYLRNPTKDTISIRFIKTMTLQPDELNVTISILKTNSEIVHFPDIPVRVCPENKLLFPMIDSICMVLRIPLILQNQPSKVMKVYMTTAIDNIKQFLRFYYNLHKNTIICYLFGLHMFNGNPYPTFGIQPIMMLINVQNISLQFLVIETLFCLSLALCLYNAYKLFCYIASVLNTQINNQLFFSLFPSILYLVRQVAFKDEATCSEWIGFILNIIFFLKNSQFGTLYLLLFFLNYDFVLAEPMSLGRFVPMQLLLLVGYCMKHSCVPGSWLDKVNYLTLLGLNIFIESNVSTVQTVIEGHALMLGLLCCLNRYRNI